MWNFHQVSVKLFLKGNPNTSFQKALITTPRNTCSLLCSHRPAVTQFPALHINKEALLNFPLPIEWEILELEFLKPLQSCSFFSLSRYSTNANGPHSWSQFPGKCRKGKLFHLYCMEKQDHKQAAKCSE